MQPDLCFYLTSDPQTGTSDLAQIVVSEYLFLCSFQGAAPAACVAGLLSSHFRDPSKRYSEEFSQIASRALRVLDFVCAP